MAVSPQLLDALLSPDGETRRHAEAALQALVNPCQEWMRALPELSEPHHTQLAAVLLRRSIMKVTDVCELQTLVPQLLRILDDKPVEDAVAEIPAVIALFDEMQAKQCCQMILSQLHAPACQGNLKALHVLSCMTERAAKIVAAVGLSTVIAVSQSAKNPMVLEIVVNTAGVSEDPRLVEALRRYVAAVPTAPGQDGIWREHLYERLQQAAADSPRLLENLAQPILEVVLSDRSIDAVQVAASICEIPHIKRRLSPEEKNAVLQACLPVLLEEIKDEELDEDIQDLLESAQANMQSLLFSLNGVGSLLPMIQGGMSSPDPALRYAAMTALACAVEAAPKSMAMYEETCLQAALQLAQDSHWQVQFPAVSVLGFLCLRNNGEINLQAALATLCQTSRSPVPCLAATSCEALVSYAQNGHEVVPFLPGVLQALGQGALVSASSQVQIRAVGALAALAQAAGDDFSPYYPQVMPILLQMTGNMVIQEAVLEAATIIGEAVGDEFTNDAKALMGHILPRIDESTFLTCCSRIASVLGDEYTPYLGHVLPKLLEKALAEPDLGMEEGCEDDLDKRQGLGYCNEKSGPEQSMTVALPGRGLTRITVHTDQIVEKSDALRGIAAHARALPHHFPYEACMEKLVPLVRFRFSPDVRGAAAQAVAAVFEAACTQEGAHGMERVRGFLPIVTKSFASQLSHESSSEMEAMYALADSLSDVCYSVYQRVGDHRGSILASYSLSDANEVVEMFSKSMIDCLERRAQLSDVIAGSEGSLTGEDEYDELQGLLKAEENLLRPLMDSIGYNLKFFREQFVPIFESRLVPMLTSFLTQGSDTRARFSAVCLFDDCVEHCGPTAAEKFAPMLAEGVMVGLDDTKNGGDEELKAASFYGLSQIARHTSGACLPSKIRPIVEALHFAVSTPKTDSSNAFLHENAVSAMASLFLVGKAPFKGSGVLKSDIAVATFLRDLPLREDEDEAKFCHAGLCSLLEDGSIQIQANYSDLMRIIGETLALVAEGEEVADQDTCLRFCSILLRIQQSIPGVQKVFHDLPEDSQSAINNAMNLYAPQVANVVSP